MSGWNKDFGQLAHKSDYEKFDKKYLELIEKEREIITQICAENCIHKEVTIEEVNTAIKQLNTNKAHDYFGLTAENLSNASNHLIEHLKQLINLSFHFYHIPDILKIGTLLPVFKNKGDIKNSRNYRGITITPTYLKIIEKIIKKKEKIQKYYSHKIRCRKDLQKIQPLFYVNSSH